MSLPRAQFDDLVVRLTAESARAPGAYKAKVALLALTGYAYIFVVLLGLSVLTALLMVTLFAGKAGVLAFKLGIPLLILVGIILRALWVRLSPPEGLAITRAQAPALFDTIDEIRDATRGPRTHQVLVTDEFNAAVTQIPRLVNELQCPGEFFVLSITGDNAPMAGILKKIEHAKIYPR